MAQRVRDVPPPLGTYDTRYPTRYVVRQRRLAHGGVSEWLMQAPPWLLAAESDGTPPGIAPNEAKGLAPPTRTRPSHPNPSPSPSPNPNPEPEPEPEPEHYP